MGSATLAAVGRPTIALVGHHNVGKSLIFQHLTGARVTVANYPGTTVQVVRGSGSDSDYLDTPGLITFPTRSEDERATARALLQEPVSAILQVGDAKNLRRTLLLTLQLVELGRPMVLALNMADEAGSRGVTVDEALLESQLGLPVVPTIAVQGAGIEQVAQALHNPAAALPKLHYEQAIEQTVQALAPHLPVSDLSRRGLALFWLSGDPEVEQWLGSALQPATWQELVAKRQALEAALGGSAAAEIQRTRLAYVDHLASLVLQDPDREPDGLGATLARFSVHPVWGLPMLAAVMGAVYLFVGHFGAGVLVNLLESTVFGEFLNPRITQTVEAVSPLPLLTDLLVGPYGLWTMGMTYALALILPIVTTFFLAFGILEDSGYLPRLAVVSNRLFARMGLNGKAVLPMVLGLGCVTMATLTTRILESRRERTLATLLLALGIPCSAQLGVVMGMLAGISLGATLIWAAVVCGVMLTVGWLAARLLPGARPPLMIELPPFRRPVLSMLVVKTLARLEWYLKEVVPLFLLGTAVLFVLDLAGVLPWLIASARPLVTGWLGLPAEASEALLMGFLRRDFGASGLFVLGSGGGLTPAQVVVAMVTITLFIPCLASVIMIARERGRRFAAGAVALVFPLAFLVGGLLHRLLAIVGWGA